MEQVKSDPLGNSASTKLNLKDSRWPATEGWEKRQSLFKLFDGEVNIHFNYNSIKESFDDFKFILPR